MAPEADPWLKVVDDRLTGDLVSTLRSTPEGRGRLLGLWRCLHGAAERAGGC